MLIVTRDDEVGNPSAIQSQSANILNSTRYSTNLLEMGPYHNSQCSHDIKKIWCRNYAARTRLSRKSLSSVKRIKCRVSENERNFLEIQCEREKSTLWDGEHQLSDGGKEKKKGRTVPFMHCSTETLPCLASGFLLSSFNCYFFFSS